LKVKGDGDREENILKEICTFDVKLISGDVLITKNPCGHQGDIRKAKAIDASHPAYEKLKHLVNVIVFPSKGARPLQNMMSGGDLDGDVYMIIWDKQIVEAAIKKEPFPEPSSDDQNETLKEIHTEKIGESHIDFA